MRNSCIGWISVAAALFFVGVSVAADPVVVKLLSPKPDAVVEEVVEVEGQLAKPGGHPVVLAKPLLDGGEWWVQAHVEEVTDSGKFSVAVHFGDGSTPKQTAFVVVIAVAKDETAAKAFKAGKRMATLPEGLPTSTPVTVYRDERPPSKVRSLTFSDHTWLVKTGRRVGPGPNDFSDSTDHVRVDKKTGYLHLVIDKTDDKWACSEVVADRSLGYGEYRWVIAGEFPAMDKQVVLGLFTYETTRREIDFELSRWGDAAKPNAQFVVQPYKEKDSTHRFETGKATVLTCSLLWGKDQVRGRCWEGTDTTEKPLADWRYDGRNIPPPGKERARANLWLFDGKPPTNGTRQEVVIRSFKFLKPAESDDK